jgi:hypothetical protein
VTVRRKKTPKENPLANLGRSWAATQARLHAKAVKAGTATPEQELWAGVWLRRARQHAKRTRVARAAGMRK